MRRLPQSVLRLAWIVLQQRRKAGGNTKPAAPSVAAGCCNRRWVRQDKPDGQWHVEQNAPGELDDLYVSQAHNFLDAVESKAKVLCTLEEGLQTLKVNLAGLASAEGHNWQTIEHG